MLRASLDCLDMNFFFAYISMSVQVFCFQVNELGSSVLVQGVAGLSDTRLMLLVECSSNVCCDSVMEQVGGRLSGRVQAAGGRGEQYPQCGTGGGDGGKTQ